LKSCTLAARSYEDGQFVAAQQHFEKAVALEPGYRYAQLLLGRALHAQYRPGNSVRGLIVALARKAISTFKKYLTIDPQNEMAFGHVALLYPLHREIELRTTLGYCNAPSSNPRQKLSAHDCYAVLASYSVVLFI
jgi:tetratricopeptide (TPR) repeat protein